MDTWTRSAAGNIVSSSYVLPSCQEIGLPMFSLNVTGALSIEEDAISERRLGGCDDSSSKSVICKGELVLFCTTVSSIELLMA